MFEIDRQPVLWALRELASREEQERLWLSDGTSGEVSSLTEASCGVFDDGGVARLLDMDGFPSEIASLFKALLMCIKRVPHNAPPREQISHPSMEDVRRISRDLIDLLSTQS